MVINWYYINGYWWLLVAIFLMTIDAYSVVSHSWLFYWWLLIVILLMVINGYSIIIFCWLLYVILQLLVIIIL
jgi:hypothetical protein